MMKPTDRFAAQSSTVFRKALVELRTALLKVPADSDRIRDLEEKFLDLRDGDDVDLDDFIEITDAASQQAQALLRSLSVRQMASYIASFEEFLPDPLADLLEALDKVNELNDTDWKELCEDTVWEVSWLLGGLEAKKASKFGEQVEQWLQQARLARGKEFARKRPELVKTAREIAAQVEPDVVLRHIAQHGLAELLSNPRLGAALDARLRK